MHDSLENIIQYIADNPSVEIGHDKNGSVFEGSAVVMAYKAATAGRLDVIRHLLLSGMIDVHMDCDELLKRSLAHRHIVEFLLTSPELKLHSSIENLPHTVKTKYVHNTASTVLAHACRLGDLELIKYLCSLQTFNKSSGFIAAVHHKSFDILDFLVKNYPEDYTASALHQAVIKNDAALVEFFIDNGFKCSAHDLIITLHMKKMNILPLILSQSIAFEPDNLTFIFNTMSESFFLSLLIEHNIDQKMNLDGCLTDLQKDILNRKIEHKSLSSCLTILASDTGDNKVSKV